MGKSFIIASLVCLVLSAAWAGDWPQWGGADARNMVSPETNLPDSFSPGSVAREGPTTDPANEPTGAERPVRVDTSTAKGLRWMARLGSQCYGNPVVADGRVYLGTNNFRVHDDAVRGKRGIMLCLDEKTGGFLWQLAVPKYTGLKMFDILDLGICSSPTAEGDRLYLVNNRAEVMCVKVAVATYDNQGRDAPETHGRDAHATANSAAAMPPGPPGPEVLWRFDMIGQLNVRPHDTSNCSVLVHGDYVYVCTSNGVDDSHRWPEHPEAPSLIALDKQTGALAAVDDAGIGKNILHGQWSSPSLGVVNGRELVFFGGGDGFCYAFDAKPTPGTDGKPGILKEIWRFDCNGSAKRFKDGQKIKYPSKDGPSEIIATPVFHDGRVYVAVGQDPMHGDGPGGLCCIDAAGSGDISESGKVWINNDLHRSMSTVSVAGGLLFVADFSGAVRCLETATGKQVWVHQMRGHVWGSTMVADGKLYVGDERGDFVVLSAGREKKVISAANVGSAIYSTPVAANGAVYVASQTHLYAIGKP